MKSGYILAIVVLVITAINTWADYEVYMRSDAAKDYEWAIYLNGLTLIPIIGLVMHKNWGRVFLKLILWLWLGAIFFMGIAIANAGADKGVATSAISALRSHWLQFILFGGLLFYLNTEKVKRDFNTK